MIRFLAPYGLVLIALVLAGCGDGGSGADGVAPVAGKPVTRASQLEGTWFRRGDLSSDHLVGIEVVPGGGTITFVSAGARGMQEVTFPFVLLEGGRIRVTHPQYPTESQVAVIKVDGSALALEPETKSRAIGMIAAEFDKLSGKTLRQRLEERIVEIQAEREAMRQDLAAFLRQPHLVLVPDGGAAARIAIDATGPDGLVAYQRVGATVIARRAQLGIDTAEDGSPVAGLQLGMVLGPPGAVDISGELIRLTPRRVGGNRIAIASMSATLRDDSALHASLARDYDALLQARRQIIDAFHAKVGHFLFLESPPGNPNVAPEQLAFLRIEDEDAYRVASLRANNLLMPGSFSGAAVIQLANDEPRLRTNTHQVFADPDDPTGAFIVASRAGTERFVTLNRLTRDELAERRAGLNALIEKMKTQPLHLVGAYQSSERGYLRPARFSLASPDGKALLGTFHSDGIALELPATGEVEESMLGLVFKVAVPRPSPHVVPGGTFTEAGTFTLDLELEGDSFKVTGRVQPGDRTNRITLAPPSTASLAALRGLFRDHLQAGGRFVWDRTGSTGGSDEVLSLTLGADGDADRVTGTVGFRRDQTAPVVGRLLEADGLLVLDLTVQARPDARGRPGVAGPMRLYVTPIEETFQLSGHSTWTDQTRTRYVSYAPAAL